MKTSQSLLGQAIIPEPATNNDNLIQPLIDSVKALVIKAHSASQTANLLEFQDSVGNVLSAVDSTGAFMGAGAAPSGTVILAPAASSRNVVQPTGDAVVPLTIKAHSLTQTADLLDITTSAGDALLTCDASPTVTVQSIADGGVLLQCRSLAGPNTPIMQVLSPGLGRTVQITCADDATGGLRITGHSGTQTGTLLRIIGDGTNKTFEVNKAAIGVFGQTAAVQQATASTAGIAGIRTDTLANAVADIQTILTALRAWGVAFGWTANTA